jgi:starvation-inducible DNA-binding protein
MPKMTISLKDKKAISEILTAVLADAVILYTKTRKFHWNVAGPSFMELHKLFEHQYGQLEEAIDEIAEKINKMGFPTPGTMAEFLQHGSLKESPGKYPDQMSMIKELQDDHDKVVAALRTAIDTCSETYKDALTADFLTDLAREHETIGWTLRRYSTSSKS